MYNNDNLYDEISKRILYIRKNVLSLTRVALAETINLPAPIISRAEKGGKANEHLIQALCSNYKINEEWLRYGKGDIFIDKYQYLTKEEFDFLTKLNKLNEENKLIISNLLDTLSKSTNTTQKK